MDGDAFVSTTSARASTSGPRRPFNGCWPKQGSPASARGRFGRRHKVEVAADWGNLRSPENYVGLRADREFRVAWRCRARSAARLCCPCAPGAQSMGAGRRVDDGEAGDRPQQPRWADRVPLSCARPSSRHGSVAQGAPVRFRVSIDGQPPGPAHGLDVDEGGNGTVVEQRLYQLIRQPKPIVDRQFQIEFLDAGVETLAFTFG